MRRYFIRLLASLTLIALMVLVTLGRLPDPFVQQVENFLYDLRVTLTAPGGVDERIVVIALDERSVKAEGQWPWTRDKLAAMVTRLYGYGVVSVGFDAVFPERDMNHDLETLRLLGAQDEEFMETLENLAPGLNRDAVFGNAIAQGPTVMAYYFNTGQEGEFEIGELPMAAFDVDETMGARLFLPDADGYTSNVPEIMAGAWSAGFISNPLIDADGIVRRTPLLHRYGNAAYESFSLAMAATVLQDIALPVFVDAPLMAEGYPPLEAVEIAGRRVPLDAQGAVLVPYRGGAGSFRYVSATDVIRGEVPNPEWLNGAIAIVGATAPGLQDLRSTPFGSIYPGVEIHANVLAGILDGNFRWQPAYTKGAEVMALVGFGLLAALTLPALSAVLSTVMALAIQGAAIGLNLYLWQDQMHVLPLASTLIVVFGIFMIDIVFGYFFESRSRTQMNELFGQYVPPDLVTQMADNPTKYSMESEKRELSVLFTDIRGFTTISERLDADELSALLNRFLTPMTRVVHDTKGTIDKYMGDCVMAFWGAPMQNENHAASAVRAGLGMLRALEKLNMDLWKEGEPELAIGVGVNTGTMSVGNMGSRFRRAYTVLGDAVNLGSRLEGLTKAYGVNFIVSSFTVDEAPEFVYREVDRVRVKGKLLPVVIYEVVGEQGDVPREEMARLKQWEQFLKLYRKQAWDAAEGILDDLRKQDPERVLYQLYAERLEAFREAPPGDDWDGVYTHQTK